MAVVRARKVSGQEINPAIGRERDLCWKRQPLTTVDSLVVRRRILLVATAGL